MTSLKAIVTLSALVISVPALAMSQPDPQQANGLPSSPQPPQSNNGGVVDVSSPSALLLLGLAAGGLMLGRSRRK